MSSCIGDTKYTGPEKIVVAMDIRTTQSAVTFSYLYPDDYARVRMVNKWPGQPQSIGSAKVPSILAYRQGQCKTCGPEALDYMDDSSYDIAKWFKLHLHPSSMKRSSLPPPYGSTIGSTGFEVPSLPPSVSIDQVYTDFIGYLMQNVQNCFEQNIPNGPAIWRRLRDTLVLILTTPNGWDFAQQSVLRKAVTRSEAIKADKTSELLEFVTEGESSVHYALAYSQSKAWLTSGSTFAVVDAGGSTVDSTLYECKSTDPKVMLEEVRPSECIQAGGIFVDRAAETIIRQRLQGTHFGDDDCIADMVAAFESRTKRLFDGSQASYAVEFGSSRETDRQLGIIKGKLSMTREEVSAAFEDVIQRITSNCSTFLSGHNIKYLLLVGGLGESPYLQKKLVELFDLRGVKVVTVEEPAKRPPRKSIPPGTLSHSGNPSEGAMIWFVNQHVTARIAKATFGVKKSKPCNSNDREHIQRAQLVFTDLSGDTRIHSSFDSMLTKGTRMYSDFTVVKAFMKLCASLDNLDSFSHDIKVWDGEDIPRWITDVNGIPLSQMRTLCTLVADLSGLRASLRPLN